MTVGKIGGPCLLDTDYRDNNCSSWHFEKATNVLNIDLLMFLKPLSNLFPSTRSCPLTKSFWSIDHDQWSWFNIGMMIWAPALIPDLLDELPCLWSPLSQGWAPLSWNFKFVCYIFVCVLFNWSFRLFPTPYKRLLQTILAKQPFKSIFFSKYCQGILASIWK